MTAIKPTKNYWCAAEGCNSDDRKRGEVWLKDLLNFKTYLSTFLKCNHEIIMAEMFQTLVMHVQDENDII